MKSKLSSPACFIVLLLSVLIFGCKPDNLDFGVPAVADKLVSMEITPSSPSMAPGTSLQLEAIGKFSDKTTKNISSSVEWTTANSAIVSVNEAGMVSASSPGAAVITAASGSITDATTVTVSPLASIELTPDRPVIAPGTRQQFTATGILENSAPQDLTGITTWTSSDAGIATVPGPGFISAGTLTTGTSTIAATFSTVTGTATLTVAPVTSMTVAPSDVTIASGKAVQFTATAVLSGNRRQDVSPFAAWSSLPSEILEISSTGLGVTRERGPAVVTAALGHAHGSAVVTVADPVPVSLTVVPDAGTVQLGGELQFAAFGIFLDGSIRNCTQDAVWTTSNPQIASVGNVFGSRGLMTPLAPGTVTVSATCFGITAPAAVLTIVQSAPPAPIAIFPVNPVMKLGSTIQLTALSFSGTGPAPADITAEAVWSSSDETIVFVSQGLATALRSGFVTITATFGSFSASTFLTATSL